MSTFSLHVKFDMQVTTHWVSGVVQNLFMSHVVIFQVRHDSDVTRPLSDVVNMKVAPRIPETVYIVSLIYVVLVSFMY